MSAPMLPVYTSNTSYIKLHAREVLRLATAAILEIEDIRRRNVLIALEQVLDEECTHLFGLIRHRRYSDRDDALKRAPEVMHARQSASGAMDTCKLLKQISTMLLDNDRVPDEDKYVYLTLNDYRALS